MGIREFFTVLLVVSVATLLPNNPDLGVVLEYALLTPFYTFVTLLDAGDATVVRYLEYLIPEFTPHGIPLNCVFRVPKLFYDHCHTEAVMGNR